MRRTLLTAALSAVSLFAFGGVALAQAPGPPGVPPAFAPPTVGGVTDVPSANAFAEDYANDHAGQFLDQRNRRAVRVTDANASCLQSPILDTRFGCVFTLKALVISRNRGWDQWGHGDSRSRAHSASVRGHKRNDRNHQERFRVRSFGCLGFLRIDSGPFGRPHVEVVNVECRRIPREDRDVTEDVTAPVAPA